jgi:hypothetical protein
LNPNNVVRVQSLDGHHVALVRGMPVQKRSGQSRTEVVFNRIDGQFFLKDIREADNSIERELPMGSRERVLAKKHNPQQLATTIAVPAR